VAEEPTGPIEVWLSQENMEVTCRIVHEDETTTEPPVDSLSMRGAQREMTGWLIDQGYRPAGRWMEEAEGEAYRQFTPAREHKVQVRR
jgi:hypothetical protein